MHADPTPILEDSLMRRVLLRLPAILMAMMLAAAPLLA